MGFRLMLQLGPHEPGEARGRWVRACARHLRRRVEAAVAELTKVMLRIESKAKPNSNQPSGGKKSKNKNSKDKKSDDRSGSRNEGSQKKELGSAHHNENADESYMTEAQLDCPDLSDSVIRSATDFH